MHISFFFVCVLVMMIFKCLIFPFAPKSENSHFTPQALGKWIWRLMSFLLLAPLFSGIKVSQQWTQELHFSSTKELLSENQTPDNCICELTAKLLGFSQGPKADNVQPGEMVCVREFILGCSFLLEESLACIKKKILSNVPPEGSESFTALETPAVFV